MILLFLIVMLVGSLIVMLVGSILSKNNFFNRKKNDLLNVNLLLNVRLVYPFLYIFLIAIIALIFDVGFALLLPIIFIMNTPNYIHWLLVSFLFLIILLMCLYHELNQYALNWVN